MYRHSAADFTEFRAKWLFNKAETEGPTTNREQTDREKLTANQMTPIGWEARSWKHFTIPRAILPKPSLCDEITVTKPLVCYPFVHSQFVAVSWPSSGMEV